jgi:hypothetical protein
MKKMQDRNERLCIHEHRFRELCSKNDPHETMRYELANYKC